MNRIASVHCMNSRGSSGAGNYEIVTISGFGAWSKDDDASAPRFATAQFSAAPDAPYASIFVFQNPDPVTSDVVLSNANTKPALKPIP